MKEKIIIDAEKLAKTIFGAMMKYGSIINVPLITQLITSSIDLNIDWVDGRAEWGIFGLHTWHGIIKKDRWYWEVVTSEYRHQLAGSGTRPSKSLDTQDLAKQACEQALRSIVCGVPAPTKSVTKHKE